MPRLFWFSFCFLLFSHADRCQISSWASGLSSFSSMSESRFRIVELSETCVSTRSVTMWLISGRASRVLQAVSSNVLSLGDGLLLGNSWVLMRISMAIAQRWRGKAHRASSALWRPCADKKRGKCFCGRGYPFPRSRLGKVEVGMKLTTTQHADCRLQDHASKNRNTMMVLLGRDLQLQGMKLFKTSLPMVPVPLIYEGRMKGVCANVGQNKRCFELLILKERIRCDREVN